MRRLRQGGLAQHDLAHGAGTHPNAFQFVKRRRCFTLGCEIFVVGDKFGWHGWPQRHVPPRHRTAAISSGAVADPGGLLFAHEAFTVRQGGQWVRSGDRDHRGGPGLAPRARVTFRLLANQGVLTQTENRPVTIDSAIGVGQHGHTIGLPRFASNSGGREWRIST